MQKIGLSLFIIVGLVVAISVISGLYVVDETQQVVITRFGEPIGDAIKDPGLHFKVPFVDQANFFDDRLLEWDGDANKIPTEDKKYIWIDTTARWRIVDPLKFLQTVHDERGAQTRLDDILDGAARNVIARYNLLGIVRDSNRILSIETTAEDKIMGRAFDSIDETAGRATVHSEMMERARAKVEEYGIDLVDIRIKRINYEAPVRSKVFERMISERKRAAEQLRSEGNGKRAEIEGKKSRELQRISSEAYRIAESIRGKADATAIKIYAESYQKDPEFYGFLNTLESYKQTFDATTTVILSTDSEYYKYMMGSGEAA